MGYDITYNQQNAGQDYTGHRFRKIEYMRCEFSGDCWVLRDCVSDKRSQTDEVFLQPLADYCRLPNGSLTVRNGNHI